MKKYRLKENATSSAGPVTFGDELPGYWTPGVEHVPGSEDTPWSEAQIDAALKANPDLPVEAVGAKKGAKKSGKPVRGEKPGVEGAVNPDDALADVDENQIGLREPVPAPDEEAKT